MKIETYYTLKQPLSHIGESEGTTTFLNTIRIVNGNKVEEVFAYTGNAIRGVLRDCAARHLLRSLGIKVGKKEFNILFSGGNISGAMSVDVKQANDYRSLLPMVSLFGAGIGNQILSGKMTQSFALPICRETDQLIPYANGKPTFESLREQSWRSMTGTISFTRMDDTKDVNLQDYLDGDPEEIKQKNAGEASTQMRYEVEYMAPGSVLYHEITLTDETELEVGALMTAFREFAKNPVLGGMGGKGFGLCSFHCYVDNSHAHSFGIDQDGKFYASDDLTSAAITYVNHIENNKDAIIALLGGVAL